MTLEEKIAEIRSSSMAAARAEGNDIIESYRRALEKVFERFYKQDEFAQGTGLGLAICKTIAERLDGDILISSEEGKGSRFTLKIPVRTSRL